MKEKNFLDLAKQELLTWEFPQQISFMEELKRFLVEEQEQKAQKLSLRAEKELNNLNILKSK